MVRNQPDLNAVLMLVLVSASVFAQTTTCWTGSGPVTTTCSVGIGTASPGYKLDVSGDVNVTSGSAFRYNGVQVVNAQTAFTNYYFGNSGNTTGNGTNNTAVGSSAFLSNTSGGGNAALGVQAMMSNTAGASNSALGVNALFANTLGNQNSALGSGALFSNTTGSNNTAVGYLALVNSNTGSYNSAVGVAALNNTSLGDSNTAVGFISLHDNTAGSQNTAIGVESLHFNTTGSQNAALGAHAGEFLANGSGNQTSGNSVFLGFGSRANAAAGDNEIVIGYNAIGNGSGTITLGNTDITKTVLRGNVGIGTTSPNHRLSVAGAIGAQEVVVLSSGADYVFEPGYRLVPLSEVANYIAANHHLPEIPSAKEGAEKGVGLGAMQTKLLAKIEELTLHMIEAEKENRELRDRVGRLEAGK